jgi:purine nucleosidase
VDTDFAGDPDDACALAFLLGTAGVELVGVTTNLDADGLRAGCAAQFLARAGRRDVEVAAGARTSWTTGQEFASTAGDARYWDQPVTAPEQPPGAALDLLRRSIDGGATVVAIGAFTNLAFLERETPGALAGVPVVATAGWFDPLPDGFPPWGPEMDFNVECDPQAAALVFGACTPTLVQPSVSIRAQLRARELPRLRAAGPIGALLARQSALHGRDRDFATLARDHAGLADDLVNFHWDPLTAAVATGWPGAAVDDTRVVRDVDTEAFTELWLRAVEAIASAAD